MKVMCELFIVLEKTTKWSNLSITAGETRGYADKYMKYANPEKGWTIGKELQILKNKKV